MSRQLLSLGFQRDFQQGWSCFNSAPRQISEVPKGAEPCPLDTWCGGAGPGILFYARRLWDPAGALGLRERLSSTAPTDFLAHRGENSLLLFYSIVLGFQVFFLAVSAYHKLGKWPKVENMWSDSGRNGNGAGKAQRSRAEPGYVMETRTAGKQGKGSLASLQSKLNNRGEAHLLSGIQRRHPKPFRSREAREELHLMDSG